MIPTIRCLAVFATVAFAAPLAAPLAATLAAQDAPPTSGMDVIARMRSRHAGEWYKTLTFRQTTTIRRSDGRDTVQTWYETLRYTPERGTQLRIDVAPLVNGNASISTWDSTWVIRADTLAAVRASGNPFLALIEGAYMQPVGETVRQLAPLGFDLSKLRTAAWNGQAVWIVGSTDPADTTSAQFWVEDQHLMVVRIVLSGGAGRQPLDIHLGAIVPCGKGWLATKVEMLQSGQRRQLEEYHDWRCDVTVDPRVFDPHAGKR
ncbi:MAG: hypothetical protein C0497_03345 [Gemmatimonas sp.]|nr:hypothetical protein [Gemmatimonas sp.]